MTWRVRLATADEYEAVREMAMMNHAASCPEKTWSEDRARETFFGAYLDRSECMIWVADRSDEIVGFLQAVVCDHRTFVGHYTAQEVLFVRPERRGSRAAALLMKQLIDWSRRIGATEIMGGNDNEVQSEQTARFLSRFGFRAVGYAMRLDIDGT